MPLSSFSDSNPGEELRLGDQLIRHDRSMTQRAYAGITTDSAAECGCTYCRNFLSQRNSVYPPTFMVLLDRLGIDFSKEAEVYECGPSKDGKRFYGGWFFLTGQIIEHGENHVQLDGVEYWIQGGRSLPSPNGEFGLDLLALNFTTQIPWVLTEAAD